MTGDAPEHAAHPSRFLRTWRRTAPGRIERGRTKRQEPKRHEPHGRLQEKRLRERIQRKLSPDPGSAEPARRAAEQTVEAGRNGTDGRRWRRWHFSGRRRGPSQDVHRRDRTQRADTDGGASLKPQERKPDDRRARRAISQPARTRSGRDDRVPTLQVGDLRRRRNATRCAGRLQYSIQPLPTATLVKPITSIVTTETGLPPSSHRRTNATGGRCTGPQHPVRRATL
jgi:hypothetical protein